MKVVSLSENTLVVLFDQNLSKQTANAVRELKQWVETELTAFVIDIIPSYASLHLSFNLNKIAHHDFVNKVESLIQQIAIVDVAKTEGSLPSHLQKSQQQNLIEIPVYYGAEVGFDLNHIMQKTGLTMKQIIQVHSNKTYDVFALGFAPGFAYLGTLDEKIAIPRKETPRLTVPQGSLGIAGEQTAIYPFDSPGGWNIIGKTPLTLVDYDQHPPCLFEVGDRITFKPISKTEFLKLGGTF